MQQEQAGQACKYRKVQEVEMDLMHVCPKEMKDEPLRGLVVSGTRELNERCRAVQQSSRRRVWPRDLSSDDHLRGRLITHLQHHITSRGGRVKPVVDQTRS